MKELIGAIAVMLTFAGYMPYIRDTLKGKTQPHAYSWFIWGFVTAVVFTLQLSDHAGPGAYVTLASSTCLWAVFVLSLRHGGQHITRADTALFCVALIATALWLIARQPTVSVILLVSVDMLGFAPTVRKSWHKPQSETVALYQFAAFRQALSILALQSYTTVTLLFPITWACANALFAAMIIIRRRYSSPA